MKLGQSVKCKQTDYYYYGEMAVEKLMAKEGLRRVTAGHVGGFMKAVLDMSLFQCTEFCAKSKNVTGKLLIPTF